MNIDEIKIARDTYINATKTYYEAEGAETAYLADLPALERLREAKYAAREAMNVAKEELLRVASESDTPPN